MKRIFKCMIPLLCLSLVTGCSGGIYTNYRELDELMIVQTMGFDSAKDGFTVSATTGKGASESAKIMRMSAQAESITLAEQIMQDYSAAEEIFYAHVNYIVLGAEAAKSDLTHCLDFIRRSPQMRPDTPLFAVTNGSAAELILGSGGEDYDATDTLRSLERNLERRGDCRVFSAKEVIAASDRNGSALICAVKTVDAGNSLQDAEDELTALPDGYVIIKNHRSIGQISYSDALAVSLIQNKAGPARLTANADGESLTVQLESCECALEPVMKNGRLGAVKLDLKIEASLPESGGNFDPEKANSVLAKEIKTRLQNVLTMEKRSSCDFLQLGGILETSKPFEMAGMGRDFQNLLPNISFIVNVKAEVHRSFDTDLTEEEA